MTGTPGPCARGETSNRRSSNPRIRSLGMLALAACSGSQQVTPWLRTSVDRPFEIMAESGGPKAHAATERLIGGRWVVVAHQAQALALSNGRAIYATDTALVVT